MIRLYQSHYLVRANIAICLKERVFRSLTSGFALQNAAFELFFCYTLEFDVRKHDTKASALLKQAAMSPHNLLNEVNRARQSYLWTPRGGLFNSSSYRGFLSSSYDGRYHLENEKSTSWLRKEILDVESTFETEHPVISTMQSMLVEIFLFQEKWEMAQEVETKVMRWSPKTQGDTLSDILLSKGILALILRRLHNWEEAEALQTQVLTTCLLELGVVHEVTISNIENLVLTFQVQGKLERAE